MRRAHARQPARHDLAALGDELRQQAHIFIVDRFNLLGAELADLFATEEFPSAWAALAPAARAGTRWPAFATAFAAALSICTWCWFGFVSHNAPSISSFVVGRTSFALSLS